MNRQQMLAILSSMDDEHLMRACEANGIECGSEGGYMGEMGDQAPSADGLESWNNTRIDVPASKRPPLVDHSKITAQQAQPPRRMHDLLGREETGLEHLTPPPGEVTGAY